MDRPGAAVLEPGEPAPDFALPVLRAGSLQPNLPDTFRLADHVGSVLVLDFWNTLCAPCLAEHETLVKLAVEYSSEGVLFVGLTRDTRRALARFVEEHGEFPYPQLSYSQEVSQSYSVLGWPTKVVVNPAGEVVWWHVGGPTPEDTLVAVLENALAEQ